MQKSLTFSLDFIVNFAIEGTLTPFFNLPLRNFSQKNLISV